MQKIVYALALVLVTGSIDADVVAHQSRGKVWIDASEAGVMVTVDRIVDGAFDGVIDDEYFLMTSRDADASDDLMPLAEWDDAEVRVSARSMWVISRSTGENVHLYLESEPGHEAIEASPADDVMLQSGQMLARRTTTKYAGFGLRHSWLKVTRETQMNEHRFAGPRTDAACDAGGGCASSQCSIEGCDGRPSGCSVTCSALNGSACCNCTPKAACSCLAC